MKKCAAKILSLSLCLSLLGALLLLSGCNDGTANSSPTPSFDADHDPDSPAVVIMVEDTLYQLHGTLDRSIKIEDSQILGYVSKCLLSGIPRHNGEACWVPEGTPYARCPSEEYPDGMVVLHRGLIVDDWWILLPVSY